MEKNGVTKVDQMVLREKNRGNDEKKKWGDGRLRIRYTYTFTEPYKGGIHIVERTPGPR